MNARIYTNKILFQCWLTEKPMNIRWRNKTLETPKGWLSKLNFLAINWSKFMQKFNIAYEMTGNRYLWKRILLSSPWVLCMNTMAHFRRHFICNLKCNRLTVNKMRTTLLFLCRKRCNVVLWESIWMSLLLIYRKILETFVCRKR